MSAEGAKGVRVDESFQDASGLGHSVFLGSGAADLDCSAFLCAMNGLYRTFISGAKEIDGPST